MSDKYVRLVDDIKATIGEARAQLQAKGAESTDIAYGLFAEALIEMFGLDYGEQVLATIAKRCLGYSEELMGMCIVENLRNSAGALSEEVRKIEKLFAECQENRASRGQGVIEQAARAVTERHGPFPAAKDLRR